MNFEKLLNERAKLQILSSIYKRDKAGFVQKRSPFEVLQNPSLLKPFGDLQVKRSSLYKPFNMKFTLSSGFLKQLGLLTTYRSNVLKSPLTIEGNRILPKVTGELLSIIHSCLTNFHRNNILRTSRAFEDFLLICKSNSSLHS